MRKERERVEQQYSATRAEARAMRAARRGGADQGARAAALIAGSPAAAVAPSSASPVARHRGDPDWDTCDAKFKRELRANRHESQSELCRAMKRYFADLPKDEQAKERAIQDRAKKLWTWWQEAADEGAQDGA